MKMRFKIYFGLLIAIVSAMIYAVCISRNIDAGVWYGVLAVAFAIAMITFDWGLRDIQTMHHDCAFMAKYIAENLKRNGQWK